jgi:hypothetical protein
VVVFGGIHDRESRKHIDEVETSNELL